MGQFKLPTSLQKVIQKASDFHCYSDKRWNPVTYPVCSLSTGDLAEQCGPFICYYAEAFLQNMSLVDFPDIKLYREHIVATLVGSCDVSEDLISDCHVCKLAKKSRKENCQFCERIVHIECLKRISCRGKLYSICNYKPGVPTQH